MEIQESPRYATDIYIGIRGQIDTQRKVSKRLDLIVDFPPKISTAFFCRFVPKDHIRKKSINMQQSFYVPKRSKMTPFMNSHINLEKILHGT